MKLKLTLLTAGLVAGTSLFSANAADISKEDVVELYKKHCTSCHGDDGKGQTRMGRKAGVKDYTDPEFVKTIKDDKALEEVKEGIKEKGKYTMKPYKSKLSDDEIKALIAYMKDFAKK